MIDRKRFFDGVRQQPFSGKLKQAEVDGMNAILDEWDRRKLTDLRWLAYMLGTTKWETDHTMLPIKEKGSDAYFKRYDIKGTNPSLARRLGNLNPGDGALYCGRGYVQLTGRYNYRNMGKYLGQPLEEHPSLAMRDDIAAQIMFEGMIRGMFTGKKLADYFNVKGTDWINARRIINGTDRAETIAGIAKQFYADLVAASAGKAVA